jgi:hypothetical protein
MILFNFFIMLCGLFGAQGEIRTLTPVKAGDFEACPCICNIKVFSCDAQTLLGLIALIHAI